jgi:hypothetical protein
MPFTMRRLALALVLLGPLTTTAARAAPVAADKATAEALFAEGRKLMAAGTYAEACPKFEASQKLDPGVGAMLNLADCYEKNGQTASAWAEFREATSAARDAGSKDREELARGRARALEPKLSRLTIIVGRGQGVQVTRDGSPVDAAAFGTAMPVDPGKHLIAVSAPGKRKWSTTVEVGAAAAQVSVQVPALVDEPQGSTTAASAGTGTGQAGAEAGPPPGGSQQRTIAIAVGVVGVAGVMAGTVLGLKAKSSWNDAKASCKSYPADCSDESNSLSKDAKGSANLATVAFAIGAAGLAGGVVLWLTAPKRSESEPKVTLNVGPASVALSGRF